ncbi:sensor histidine kinase [Saltatorellus ferox]|uniref:sensor histidine kinase n=1 Tax=Saltatorellus ferox TaxID=2528018 RepID=UPI003AF369EC
MCTGAATALIAAALWFPLFSGQRPLLISLLALMVPCAVTAWMLQSVAAAEARLQAALARSQGLDRANAELRRFAQTVAHDLRAPLVSASGYLEMARENARSGEVQGVMQLLDRASETARRMDGLISGLLELASGDEVDLDAPIDLDRVAQNALNDLAPALERSGVEVHCAEPLGTVLGDARYVQQAFDNVLGNALKYGRPTDGYTTPMLEIRAERLASTVRISIADNGPGIPAQKRQALLQGATAAVRQPKLIFGDGHRPLTGANAGLGLGLVSQAMKECGGSLSIQTSALGGAEFVLEFRADPCVQHSQIPASLPDSLPRRMLADHASCSSRMTLITG